MATIYRCPFCYNNYTINEEGEIESSSFEHDPILTKSGTKYTLESEDGGVTWNWINHENDENFIPNFQGLERLQNNHIIEIQEEWNSVQQIYIVEAERIELDIVEEDIIDRFNKKHIRDLRNVVTKVLAKFAIGWAGFFNYAILKWMGTYQTNWHDPDLDNYKGRIKNVHIEDFRHHYKVMGANPVPHPTLQEDIESDSNSTFVEGTVPPWYWSNSTTWPLDIGYNDDDPENPYYHWGLSYHAQSGTIYDGTRIDTDHYIHSVTENFQNQYPEANFSFSKSIPNLTPPSDIISYTKSSEQERINTKEYEGSYGTITRGGINGYRIDYYQSPDYPDYATDGTIVQTDYGDISEYEIIVHLHWSLVDSYIDYYGYDYAVMKLTGALSKEIGVPKWD